MLRNIKTKVFYPYSPERVWQAIANARSLAAWLMDNDFEPRLGHKFRFQAQPLPGLNGTIHCEIIELEEPKRLSYTWRENLICQPSIVTWTLLPVEGGTQLQLEHKGFESEVIKLREPMRLSRTATHNTNQPTMSLRILEPANEITQLSPERAGFESLDSIALNFSISDEWNHLLNHRLAETLVRAAADELASI